MESFSNMVNKAIDLQEEDILEVKKLNREDMGGKNPSKVPKTKEKDKKAPKNKGAKDDPVDKGIKRQDI